MDQNMKGNSIKIVFMERGNINEQMVDHTLVLGKVIKCTGKGYLNGQMGENMKAIILKIKNMGKGILNGRMEENIQAHGSVIIFYF